MAAFGLSDDAARIIAKALRYYRDYEDAQDRPEATDRLTELADMLDPPPPPTPERLADLLRAAAAALEGKPGAASPRITARVIRDTLARLDGAT